jgi:hypothetical protein
MVTTLLRLGIATAATAAGTAALVDGAVNKNVAEIAGGAIGLSFGIQQFVVYTAIRIGMVLRRDED